MNMIFDSANNQCWIIHLLEDPRLIGPKSLLNIFGNPWRAMFGAIYQVNQVFYERLRHWCFLPVIKLGRNSNCVLSSRPEGSITCQPRATPWECDPRYRSSPERAAQIASSHGIMIFQFCRSSVIVHLFRPVGAWGLCGLPFLGRCPRLICGCPIRGGMLWLSLFPKLLKILPELRRQIDGFGVRVFQFDVNLTQRCPRCPLPVVCPPELDSSATCSKKWAIKTAVARRHQSENSRPVRFTRSTVCTSPWNCAMRPSNCAIE